MSGSLFRRTIPEGATIGTHVVDDGYALRTFHSAPPAPNGSILFLGGRGDFFEKYLEAFGEWHAEGWAVEAFDWRGHGGSPRLTGDPLIGHSSGFARLVADLADFGAGWQRRSAGPRIVIGHSMGGHLLLRTLAERRLRPDGAVLLSPMLRIRTPLGSRLSETIAAWQVRRGNGTRSPWRENEGDANRLDSMSMMTNDLDRYLDEQFWLEENPAFRLGPPSWGWLAEAFASTRRLRESEALRSLDVPLLLMVADRDRLTHSPEALRQMKKLRDVTVRRFGREAAHELLRERDSVRGEAMAAIRAFMDRFRADR